MAGRSDGVVAHGVLHDVVVAGDEVKGDEHGQPRDSQDEGDCGKDGRH